MNKNVLKSTDFCYSFLTELLNNIVIALYILNNLAPMYIPGTLQLIFNSNILVLFIPIFLNTVTLLFMYHLDEHTRKEKQVRIIVGSTIRRMKYQSPSLLMITNFVAVIFTCIIIMCIYSLFEKFYLIFIVTSAFRLSILVIITFIKT